MAWNYGKVCFGGLRRSRDYMESGAWGGPAVGRARARVAGSAVYRLAGTSRMAAGDAFGDDVIFFRWDVAADHGPARKENLKRVPLAETRRGAVLKRNQYEPCGARCHIFDVCCRGGGEPEHILGMELKSLVSFRACLQFCFF